MKTWLMGAVVGNDIEMCNGSSGIIFINPDGTGSGGSTGEIIDPGTDPGKGFNAVDVKYKLKTPGLDYYTNR